MELPSNVKHKRVQIIDKNEPETTIRLEDGTIIKIRTVVFGVNAVYNEDGSRMMNPDGSPLYAIHTQQMQFVDTFETIPKNVKRN